MFDPSLGHLRRLLVPRATFWSRSLNLPRNLASTSCHTDSQMRVSISLAVLAKRGLDIRRWWVSRDLFQTLLTGTNQQTHSRKATDDVVTCRCLRMACGRRLLKAAATPFLRGSNHSLLCYI
jgi:hypothetical protein